MTKAMLGGSCHCGRVRIAVPGAPEWVGACNCSLCRRTGWIAAFYPEDAVRIEGETAAYIWGDRMIGIHHCPTCGCATHWLSLGEEEPQQSGTSLGLATRRGGKMGVNARMLDGFSSGGAPVPGGVRIGGVEVEVRPIDNAG